MTRAFVFSGGASHGALQVGMVDALADHGIVPDLVTGTSVGAINGGWLAGGGDAAGLADIWRGLERDDVFPTNLMRGLRAFTGRKPSYFSDEGLRTLLAEHLLFERLENTVLPITVIATDEMTGEEVRLTEGDAVDAIVASASIPALLPPVEIGGRRLVDGAVVNNTPISVAIEAGATEVWVLTTGFGCPLETPPGNAFAAALHAVGLMVQRRLVLELANADYPVPVHIVPVPCPVDVSPIDFSQSEMMIDRARDETQRWLAAGAPASIDTGG
ncbi:MAG: patatin-like phospholipase family protein [Actinomycetota bacterium]